MSDETPLTLSVVVPAFNEEACLPATLAAVSEAARGLPCEVVVVDNESTDRTRDTCSAVSARFGMQGTSSEVASIKKTAESR